MGEEKCFCQDHSLRGVKLEQNCRSIDKMNDRISRIDEDLHGKNGLFTQVALLEQMLKNLKWPLVIITVAAATQIIKIIFSAAPVVNHVIGG